MGPAFHIQVGLLGFMVYSCLGQDAQDLKCPKSWFHIGEYCYGYIEQPLDWIDAESECNTYGPDGHLASIHSDDEMNLLAKYILSNYYSRGHIWIGLYTPDVGWRRWWKWIDESPTDYLPWNVLEPDNLNSNEKCVELYTYDLLYWNDVNCSVEKPYVCKVSPS